MTASGKNRPALLAICGWPASGKTLLIEQLAARLLERGLKVLVIKRAAHQLDLDQDGKDSHRFYQAGADVFAYDKAQSFLHRHGASSLEDVLRDVGAEYDVVLVEGHKSAALPKVWLLREGEDEAPEGVSELRAVLPFGPERLDALLRIVEQELAER